MVQRDLTTRHFYNYHGSSMRVYLLNSKMSARDILLYLRLFNRDIIRKKDCLIKT